MITALTSLISGYGPLTVLVAVVLYVVLRGEFQFRYPRAGEKTIDQTKMLGPVNRI